jgi:hypothetical protein
MNTTNMLQRWRRAKSDFEWRLLKRKNVSHFAHGTNEEMRRTFARSVLTDK